MENTDLKKYKKIQDLFHKKNIENKFICKNCGKEFKRFHSNHLKKCRITKEEYINTYGYPNKSIEQDAILNDVIEKISNLYIVNRNKWLILSGYTKCYTTKETEVIQSSNKMNNRKEIIKLTNYQIKEHLKGKNTLGVFPAGMYSKFLVFDVDSYIGLEGAREVALYLKQFLKKYFQQEQIHISFSGKKGYHVTLYFTNFIDLDILNRLYNIVLNEIKLEQFVNVKVEMRPTTKGENGYGVKLPMGVNFINNDDYNNYAFFVDDSFDEIEYEVEYLMNIEKTSDVIVWEIINKFKNVNYKDYGESYINKSEEYDTEQAVININNNQRGKIKYILENGLEDNGTRHYWSFLIALYCKKLGMDENDTYNLLYDWSIRQIQTGMSKSNVIEVEIDIKQIIFKGVFSDQKNYHLHHQNNGFYLTKGDIDLLVDLNRDAKNTGKTMINYQKTLFVLLLYGRNYSNENGHFCLTYEKILEHTNFGSRTTVNKCITDLESMSYIKLISRDAKFNKIKNKKDPNVFMLNAIQDNEKKIEISVKDIKCENCFFKTMYDYFGRDNLDIIFTRAIKSKVLGMSFIK